MRDAHFAIDHEADYQNQRNGNCTGFRRGEDVQADAADDREQQQHRRPCRSKRRGNFGAAHPLFTAWLVAALYRCRISRDHQDNGAQNARQHTCHEHLANGNIRNQTIDDERNAGRNDRRNQRASCRHRAGERFVIATLDHFRHHHAGEHGAVGQIGSADATHQGGNHDVGECHAAAHTTDQNFRDLDQTFCNAGMRHHRTKHDEERNGKQRRVLCRADEALHGNRYRHLVEKGEIGEDRNQNGHIEAHIERDQRQHDENDGCQVHALPPAKAARKDLNAPANI